MKLLHFADLHVGVENYGATDPQTGLSTRLLDFLTAFDELVEFALAQRVDAVLFAGDAYKSRDPSQTHQREFAKRIARLASAGIPVVLVVGNHDLPHIATRANALEIFPTLAVQKVFVADRLSTTVVPTDSGPLQVVALPWIRRAAFLAREETRDLTLDEITRLLEERITTALHWELERLDAALPAVLVGHVTVAGATVGSERSMMLGRDHALLLSTLTHTALDYVALGHVHKHQILSQRLPVVYSGSLQRVDFSEEDETKGFVVIDLDPSGAPGSRVQAYDFQPVDARPFLTIDVKAQDDPDPTGAVLRAIARRHIQGAVVRVRVRLDETSESRFREQEVRDALQEAHYIASIQRDVARPLRTRLAPERAQGLGPIQALRLYLESQGLASEEAARLVQYGEGVLREELGEEDDSP